MNHTLGPKDWDSSPWVLASSSMPHWRSRAGRSSSSSSTLLKVIGMEAPMDQICTVTVLKKPSRGFRVIWTPVTLS